MDGTGAPAIRSTCPYCGVGCGVKLSPDGAGGLTVTGDEAHPANFGKLCSKGMALGETVGLEGRLLTPQVDGRPASWDEALDTVAERFKATIAEHGPDSVAFYVSGQLLTEDYYVANKLIKGFMGTANIDTNSRLCMASTVAGHKRAFGSDTVPGTYEDLEEADLIVLVGSNLAWCHPVLYQRIVAARAERGTKIVVIDPRRTATCDIADLHLGLAAGSDVALFNGLFAHLHENGALDKRFILDHTNGFDDAFTRAASADLSVTGLDQRDIERFYQLFASTERVVTIFSQGVNQSSAGTDKVNSILNCHLATGRIGKPGMGPFSVTGQPNAMGGREVGGLANMLAAHLDIENPDHLAAVRAFWDAPNLADTQGLKAIDMFRAVGDGRIRAIWIACTNPVVSLPDAGAVADALKACPFVVVSDLSAETDTARLADVVLPATGWGEKDGTVTNSDRTISRQRPALPAPGSAKHDWQIFTDVGRRMGWTAAFDFETPAEVFREHAALSGLAAGLGRDFDISGLAGITSEDYDALEPTRWPISAKRQGGRYFADGGFFTPSGRANFVAVSHRAPATDTAPAAPFRLNSGRVRDQWHTMTRTARAPRLNRHLAEPYLQIHPADAALLGLAPADLARVHSPQGEAILRVLISTDVPQGAPFAPMHWTGETAAGSLIGKTIAPETDPISGQPESKAASVAITRFEANWYAFAISTTRIAADAPYWAQVKTDKGWRAELAGINDPEDWIKEAQCLFDTDAQPEVFEDPARRVSHLAFYENGRLTAALFVSPEPVSVARDFVTDLLGTEAPNLLVARPGADIPDPGPTVCACLGVGRNTILNAIADAPGVSVDLIGERTGAGTNCGSCRAEIADLIQRFKMPTAAE